MTTNDNDLLPTSEYVLLKLTRTLMPSDPNSALPDLREMYFLRELISLRLDSDADIARLFFEYFCLDRPQAILEPLLRKYYCWDLVSETLESTYSDVIANQETGEPMRAHEFGIGDPPKPQRSVQSIPSREAKRELLFSDASGIYIPRRFAREIARDHVSFGSHDFSEGWDILENPDHERYWEAWQEVLDHATLTDGNGVEYRLEQDGDCWMVEKAGEYCAVATTGNWEK